MTTFMFTVGGHANLTSEYAALRDANIDVLINYTMVPASDPYQIGLYLDACYDHGLRAALNIVPLTRDVVVPRPDKVLSAGELAAITTFVNEWKDHPAVWGWYTDDEGTDTYPISTREQVYATVKAAHPEGQVAEAHFKLAEGAYSPDVHDWFLLDAGAEYGELYGYKFSTYAGPPNYGCIDLTTGLVTERAAEAQMLTNFEDNLTYIKGLLDTAGEQNTAVLFGAFHEGVNDASRKFAMPPAAADGYDGGITRMWDAAVNAGLGDHAAWFLWWYWPYTTGTTDFIGVSADGYESQRAEIAAIAASIGGGSGFGDFDLRLSGSTGDFDLRLQSLVTTRRRQRIALGGV